MDILAKYVMDTGFSEKAREFRKDFFTKAEFESALMQLVSQEEMKRFQTDVSNENKRIKDKIGET